MLVDITPICGDDDPAVPGQIIEFRCTEDDAWYPVRISLQGETLVITFVDFPDEADKERFSAGNFTTLKDVIYFRSRFRSVSQQVQDEKCYEVRKRGRVCALFVHGDLRVFYDAEVDDIKRVVHTYTAEGDEVCQCEFFLVWRHGPKAGTMTSATIANLCQVLPESKLVDPRLTSFLTMLEVEIPLSLTSSAADIGTNDEEARSEISDDVDMGGGYLKAITIKSYNQVETEDVDGGVAVGHERLHHHHILIDNLEKDLVPSVVESFIFEHTCVHGKAYIFPSLLTEAYARGMIVVDAAENIEKVQSFLEQSDQMIVSSKGRPWIVLDQEKYESSNFEVQSIVSTSQAEVGEKLKIVHSGSREYKRAERQRKMIGDFADQLVVLHRRQKTEVEKIMSMSDDSV